MSFIETGLIPTLVVGEIIGAFSTFIVLKLYQKYVLHLDPEQDRQEWEERMQKTATNAAIQAAEDVKSFIKSPEFPSIDVDSLNKNFEAITANIAGIPAVIKAELAEVKHSFKMSEAGLEGGAARRVKASIREMVKQDPSQRKAMMFLKFMGFSPGQAAQTILDMGDMQSEMGGEGGSPAAAVDLSRLK